LHQRLHAGGRGHELHERHRKLMEEMDNVPFVDTPVKERYLWRDVQRQAEHYGFPISLPVEYPLKHFDLANRVAIVAKQEGWCAEYVTMTYRLWFQEGLAAGGEANLDRCLQETGPSRARVMDLANSERIKTAYEAATDEARSLGIFGSPTFVVADGELFWGNDRLEDAVRWALRDSELLAKRLERATSDES
jgi:2-hydroxychromene-2-carboxylate isomerase